MLPTATVDIKPNIVLGNGRYLLDCDGRLHHERFGRLIRAVAAVIVTMKEVPLPVVEKKIPAQPVAKDPKPAAPVPPKAASEGKRNLGYKQKPSSVRVPRIVPEDPDIIRKPAREPATRAEAIMVAARIDTKAYAAAARARAEQPKPEKPAAKPLEVAMSPDPCWQCGANGRRGCEHQLPFEGYPDAR